MSNIPEGTKYKINCKRNKAILNAYLQFRYNCGMVADDVRNLAKYRSLDESLRSIASSSVKDIPVFHSFMRNPDHTVVFTVEKGFVMASTSWRESPESMEAIAACRVEKGMFVLFLPGESFLVKAGSEDTEAVMRVLGDK